MEFAAKYDPKSREWPELLRLRAAIAHRQETLISPRGLSEGIEDLPNAPPNIPTVPAYLGSGFQHQRFGADLALELCRNSLELLFPKMRSTIEKLVVTSEREAILLAVTHARDAKLLNPQE